MKKILLLSVLAFSSCANDENATTLSAPDAVTWSKTFGGSQDELGGGMVATPDGGLLVVGTTYSSDHDIVPAHAGLEILVTKFDGFGNVVWTKTIGGSLDDYGTSIIATRDGNYVVAGYSGSSDGDVPANLGMHDFVLFKINGQGEIIWSKNYGFTSHDHAHKIIELSDGGFFIAGYADYAGIQGTPGDGNHGEDHEMRGSAAKHGVGEYFGIRLDSAGNFKWYRYFGGTMNDRVNDIVEANDGGIIMAGYSESDNFDITEARGSYDYWVIKLHSDGGLHWKRNYGGTGIDQAFGIAKTKNNSYIVVGRSNSEDLDVKMPMGNFDAWVIHINDHGDLLWQKSFGGSDYDGATTIKRRRDGQFLIAGNTRGNYFGNAKGENDSWLFCIDHYVNTNIHWQKTFGGANIDMAAEVIETNDGIFVLSDSQSDNGDVPQNKGFNDFWLVKLQ